MADSRIDIGTLERRAIYTSSASTTAKVTGLDAEITYRYCPAGRLIVRRDPRFADRD